MKLPLSFYEYDTLTVARRLLGQRLVHVVNGKRRSGIIIEVEAYQGPEDKAAHSHGNRRTARTEVMFGAPGHAYVYLIYGMYDCFNIITAPEGVPHGILVRAIMPDEGIEEMLYARYGTINVSKSQMRNLTNGPGKLCKAMCITRVHNGVSLFGNTLYIEACNPLPYEITTGPRINIDYAEEAVHYPWRFYYKGHPGVSK
ncbi:DNA-3-methyladenine glycosylase [Ectobacillus antri]|uniref:DNA-3-methyladenine glycosylase n=1 Tax=Ectobacillus antri TaxID=2486280 RepID=UPI000F59BB35|nr:DNA-3-methyladenine glycosylase [Ectobacillus antri]